MGKVIDITEKLSMGENPKIKIKENEYEIRSDAETVLQIMGLFSSKSEDVAAMEAYQLLFSEKDRKVLEKQLLFRDLMIVIQEAFHLATGENGNEGEVQTRTMI